jgi:hypothetical protein
VMFAIPNERLLPIMSVISLLAISKVNPANKGLELLPQKLHDRLLLLLDLTAGSKELDGLLVVLKHLLLQLLYLLAKFVGL